MGTERERSGTERERNGNGQERNGNGRERNGNGRERNGNGTERGTPRERKNYSIINMRFQKRNVGLKYLLKYIKKLEL